MKWMKNAATLELYGYWDRLRGERLTPDRADIDPGAIRGVLADTFVLDISNLEKAPLRIAGARLGGLFLDELKGRDFLTLWRSDARQAMRELLENVATEAKPAIAGVQTAPAGRPLVDFELLLMPLRHFGKTHDRLLGCLSPVSVPLWLGLVPTAELALGAMRFIRTPAQAAMPLRRELPEVGSLPRRHAHLYVHEGKNPS